MATMFKRNKFRNEPTTVDGIRFASKKEAKRYGELKVMEAAGVISDLRLQVPYDLKVADEWLAMHHICRYIADFVYTEAGKDGDLAYTVVEDAKGFRTPEYKLKAKLMKACHGITIREV